MAFLGSADRIDYSLKKVSLAGGSPITLIDRFTSGPWGSGVWLDDGTIVVSRVDSGLWRIRQDGGAPEPLTILRDDDWSHRPAAVLPDWRVLFTVVSNARLEFRIDAVSLDSGERRLVLDNAASLVPLERTSPVRARRSDPARSVRCGRGS